MAKLRLTYRDWRILDRLFRYQLELVETCHHVLFKAKKLEAARSTLRRLAAGGYLEQHTEPFHYYRLTPQSLALIEPVWSTLPCERFRLDVFSGPITRRAFLIERVALLSYCSLGQCPRTLLTWPEFMKWFPGYAAPPRVPAFPYAIDQVGGEHVLSYHLVDTESDAANQLRRVKKFLIRVQALEPARALLMRNRLRVRFLVHGVARKTELTAAFAEISHVDVGVIPLLKRVHERGVV